MKFSKFASNKFFFIFVAAFVIVALAFSATMAWAQTASPSPTPSPSATATPAATASPTASASPLISPSATGTPSSSPVAVIPPEVTQNAKDWPMANRDYTNSRATKDSTINASNATTLGEAWHFDITGLGQFGGAASNPVILGNTVIFQDLKSNVFAFDLGTGQMKWSKMYNTPGIEGPNGPAVGYGKVFVQKDLYTMAALDINNGNELWTNKLSNVVTTGIDIAPTVYNGMVYVASVPGTGDIFYAPGGRGVIYALDQATGKIVWQFDTVKSADLFGHADVNSGGGCWYPPGIDTTTGQMFWSVANPAPFPGTKDFPSGSSFSGDTLYTDSLISLANDTGALKWYNQVIPHDIFDHDLQISAILTTATINGQQQNVAVAAGKMGNVYAFNRDTGVLLWKTPVGEHNGNDTLTQLPTTGATVTLPGVLGGVETTMAYSDGVVYVPTLNLATSWFATGFDPSVPFDARKGTGDLTALDVNSGQALWIAHFPYPDLGGATVVNDLVFTATYDGTIYALNRTTGATVFTYKASAGINAWPAVAGDTIVWPAGAANTPGNQFGSPRLIALKLGKAVPAGSPTPAPSASPSSTASPAVSPSVSPSPSPSATSSPAVSPSASPSASPSGSPSATGTSSPAAGTTVNLTAQNIAFNMSTITVKAGAPVTINFTNNDAGILHNFSVYTNQSATTAIFTGDLVTGPGNKVYSFTAPSTPGTYFFRCDVHPAIMTGQFIVQ
jgi:outer membrane protein assembly factor BamB/plastocyanin